MGLSACVTWSEIESAPDGRLSDANEAVCDGMHGKKTLYLEERTVDSRDDVSPSGRVL
jgi:hypothetical protein